MKKKIFSRILIVLVVIMIAAKVVFLLFFTKEAEDTYNTIPQKNVCVALSYHYLINRNPWNWFMENVAKTDQITLDSVYKDEFEKQIDKLVEDGAYFATLDEVEKFKEEGEFPDKCVWLSFDDGDESVYKIAYPILKERNIPFTMFIIAGQVGNEDFENLKLANWDELREMRDSGLVSFGSHTYDMHYLQVNGSAQFLEASKNGEFQTDLKKSKEVLEEQLGITINSIAYPFGNASDTVTAAAESAGFTNGFILAPTPITSEDDPYYMNRYMLDNDDFYKVVVPWIENTN